MRIHPDPIKIPVVLSVPSETGVTVDMFQIRIQVLSPLPSSHVELDFSKYTLFNMSGIINYMHEMP